MNRIVERVRKLLAMADENSNASQGEIENALELARRLMTEHGIAEQEVQVQDYQPADIDEQVAASKSGYSKWEQRLMRVISRITDVEVILKEREKVEVVFIGYPHDTAVACELFSSVSKSIRASARAHLGKGWNANHRSYAEGFVSGLGAKARRWQYNASKETGIVLAKADNIRRYLDDQYSSRSSRSRRSRSNINSSAYSQGYVDGNATSLKNQL